MPKRFENGYIALFVTCVVMLFIIGFVFWSMMYSKGYQAADKDHQSAYATHQTVEENFRECVSEPTIEEALICYKDAYNTDREQERAEDDLDAQREMANWAEGMLWGTLLIGTITASVTALGVVYVARTLEATSETLEAARECANVRFGEAAMQRNQAKLRLGWCRMSDFANVATCALLPLTIRHSAKILTENVRCRLPAPKRSLPFATTDRLPAFAASARLSSP